MGKGRQARIYARERSRTVSAAIENNLPEPLYNVGTGKDLSIKELADIIATVGHQGDVLGHSKRNP